MPGKFEAPIFTRNLILGLLKETGGRLAKVGIQGEVVLVAGAAMVVAFKSRPRTRDVDAAMMPAERVRAVALDLAAERGLPIGWLNDAFRGLMQRAPDRRTLGLIAEFPGMRVMSAPAEYVLAMKCKAARMGPGATDLDDAKLLIRLLKLKTELMVAKVVRKYFPIDRDPMRTKAFVRAVLSASRKSRGGRRSR